MGTVFVHAARLTGDQALSTCLSAEEESRAQAFKFALDRQHYRECHGRLRHHLAHYTGAAPETLQFRHGPFDKPELLHSNWHFNLSHSHNYYAAAFCQDHPVGVDIETGANHADLLDLIPHVCHADEQRHLETTPHADQRRLFLCYWTGKESILKALGCGFQQAPETVCILGDPFAGRTGVTAPMPDVDFSSWTLHFLEITETHVITVAAPISHQVELVESLFDA